MPPFAGSYAIGIAENEGQSVSSITHFLSHRKLLALKDSVISALNNKINMVNTETAAVWFFGFVSLWVLLSALFHATARMQFSKPTLREQGNAIVEEAHGGYHTAVVCTLVLAHLSPLGDVIVAAVQRTGVSGLSTVFAAFLTDFAVLVAYSLLAFVGILAVYLAVRPLYLRTTEKWPSLGQGVSSLLQASVLHFGPAFVVLLVTLNGRWPVLSGLAVALMLVVGVPIAQSFYNRLLVNGREATAEERQRVIGDGLPSDLDIRVGPTEFDSHNIAVVGVLFDRPLAFVGADALADLSDECLRTHLQIAHEQTGWKQWLKSRAPVGAWIGLTTAVLVDLNAGFLLAVGALISSYLGFRVAVSQVLSPRGTAVPEDLDETQVVTAFAELGEVQRFSPEVYIKPTASSFAERATETSDRPDECDGDPAEK